MGRKLGSLNPALATPQPEDQNPRAVPGNNAKAIEEAEKAQLLSFFFKLRAQQKKVDAAKAILDGEKAEMTDIFRLAKAAHFDRKELQALLDDSASNTKDLAESEQRRRRHREWVGLPNGASELDMFGEETPVEVRDAAWWGADGYRAGMRDDEPAPPKECAERFIQPWMQGYHRGAEDRKAAIATAAEAPPPAPEPAAPAVEPKGDGFEMSEEELAAQKGRQDIRDRKETDAQLGHRQEEEAVE